ncbi:MAG: right-handed parallel beta-helix repeat-containing protein [Bryobacteraceae bacterium]|jgi:hypothetical protein
MTPVNRVSANHQPGKAALSFPAVILIALAATVPAQAAFIPISACNPLLAAPAGSWISTGGDYEVTADLTQSSTGDCILITASGVSLKLNGHQITGAGANSIGAGIDVAGGASRVNHAAIEGPGLIQAFQVGVLLVSADYSQVDLVSAAHNSKFGIYGLYSTYLTIGSNVLVQNGLAGLGLVTSSGGTIQNNVTNGNGAVANLPGAFGGGILLAIGSSANTVNNNTGSGNGPRSGSPAVSAGIAIQGNSNRVYANSTVGNVMAGIQIVSGTGNEIFNDPSCVGNGQYDLEDDNPSCGSDSWSSNGFFIANQPCIR